MGDYVPLIVALAALAAGGFAAIASIRATRSNQEANQIKWLADAREQTTTIRRDLDQARSDLADTRVDLVRTKRQVTEQRDLIEEATRWIIRVVDWAHDETVDDLELRRLINGGPASFRAEARRNHGDGRTREGRPTDERRD